MVRICCVVGCLAGLMADRAAEAADPSGPAVSRLPGFDWSGWYLGGHVGYAIGQIDTTVAASNPTGSTASFSSLYGGLQAGYNHVLPSRLLLGIEADVSFPNFLEDGLAATRATAQGSVTDQIDDLGTLRARLGYASDNWLFYGTGGVAWSQARLVETSGLTGDANTIERTRAGWSLGIGAETAIAAHWTARFEYLYDHLGSVSANFPSGTHYASAFDLQMLRFGLNYKFDSPGATDSQPSADARSNPFPIASDIWNIHGQFTLIGQGYPAFNSPYQGLNSLTGGSQFKNTTSATAFIGIRAWEGAEFYVDPELMQGFGLSNTLGVAGFPNGEAQKSDFPVPRFNIARAYLQQTFGLGGEQETVDDGPNQLPGKKDISRITVIAGKFAVTDFFDANAFAGEPRTGFLNWNMYGGGSYDWTMDKISYTWGALVDFNQKSWAVRAGYFLVPTVSNVNTFDTDIPQHGEYAAELELRYSLFSEPGKLRLFGWVNRAVAGSYADALALPLTSPNYPDITLTREVRTNYGFVVNAEQAITADLGVFSRATWSPGLTEIIGWTDCDESLSLGAVLKGNLWGRPNDKIGAGGVIEGLSTEARAYFAAGGLGILIGDGQLNNYRPEQIFEAYYAYSLNTWATLTADYQLIANPGYNADRGPVSVIAARLHAEF